MANSYDAETLARALPLMTRANPRLLASGTYYVAEVGVEIVGCGGWSPELPGTKTIVEHIGHVRHFAVHPNHVGRGVGRAIFERCEAQAHDSGINRFECFSSRNAVDFYRAVGFNVIREIEVEMSSDTKFPSVLMCKSLRAAALR
jgi:N-acetylglutamate synthase-like GNAT family acetyltransferase